MYIVMVVMIRVIIVGFIVFFWCVVIVFRVWKYDVGNGNLYSYGEFFLKILGLNFCLNGGIGFMRWFFVMVNFWLRLIFKWFRFINFNGIIYVNLLLLRLS